MFTYPAQFVEFEQQYPFAGAKFYVTTEPSGTFPQNVNPPIIQLPQGNVLLYRIVGGGGGGGKPYPPYCCCVWFYPV